MDAAMTSTFDLEAACSALFETVAPLYREKGAIYPALIGMRVRAGRMVDSHTEWLRTPDKTDLLIARMRRQWDTVALVKPAQGVSEDPSPEAADRHRFASIELHSAAGIARAYCCVHRGTREMRTGRLTLLGAPGDAA
jgi:hypothetical protein